MRVVILSYADHGAGAHNAARGIHAALLRHGPSLGVHSVLRVIKSRNKLPQTISGYPHLPFFPRILRLFKHTVRRIRKHVYRILGGRGVYSAARTRTGLGESLKTLTPDLILLNWVGDFTLALEELEKLQCPVIIRNADYWHFNGSAHFSDGAYGHDAWARYQVFLSRLFYGSEQNATHARKKAIYHRTVNAVLSPSTSMADISAQSEVLGGLPQWVVPNPIDVDFWKPMSKDFARTQLNISPDPVVLGFGGVNAMRDRRKGFDFLDEALRLLSLTYPNWADLVELHLFGISHFSGEIGRVRVHCHGSLDRKELVYFYNSADILCVPSREEGFSNIALEAQACGLPVVGFDIGGLREVVQNEITGVLVKPYDSSMIMEGILRLIADSEFRLALGGSSVRRVSEQFSPKAVAESLGAVFQTTLRG